MRSHRLRPLHHDDLAAGVQLNHRSVESEQFAAPPHAVVSFFRHGRKPVLPEDGADLRGGPCGNGFAAKSARTSGSFESRRHSAAQYHWIVTPLAERCEPQVPVESRLIGRVDARRFVQLLRLVAEGIRQSTFVHRWSLGIRFHSALASSPRKGRNDWRFERARAGLLATSGVGPA